MSRRGPAGLDRLTQVAEDAIGDDPRAATFVRGLALGALVGAAIAGSTIWQRRHGRLSPPVEPDPARPDEKPAAGRGLQRR